MDPVKDYFNSREFLFKNKLSTEIIYDRFETFEKFWENEKDFDKKNQEFLIGVAETAIIYGKSVKFLKLIIDNGLDVNVIFKTPLLKKTLLVIACENHKNDMAKYLLEKGAIVDSPESNTPLSSCLIHTGENQKKSNPELIEMLLLAGADIKKIRNRILTMLGENGRGNEVRLLLKYGLDPDVVSEGVPLLESSIMHSYSNDSAEIALELLSHKNIKNLNRFAIRNNKCFTTLLHLSRNVEVSKKLIELGLDPFELNSSNENVMRETSSDKKLTKYFLSLGKRYINQYTLFDYGVWSDSENVKILIENGANVNLVDKNGMTVLNKLCKSLYGDQLESIKLLLSAGANPNFQLTQGMWTSLHFLCSTVSYTIDNHVTAMKLLIEKGALPLKSASGCTPLMVMTLNQEHIERTTEFRKLFAKFEANFYSFDPNEYLIKLNQMYNPSKKYYTIISDIFGFSRVFPNEKKFDKFWQEFKKVKKNQNMILD